MMTLSGVAIAEGFIYQTLNNDVTLAGFIPDGVWPDNLPREATTRGITYTYRGGDDVEAFNNIRIAVEVLYRVVVVGRTLDLKDLEPAEAQMDALLHRASGTYQGYRIAACVRENPYRETDPILDAEWRKLGGDYRIYVVVG
jgi:hypothetical protein